VYPLKVSKKEDEEDIVIRFGNNWAFSSERQLRWLEHEAKDRTWTVVSCIVHENEEKRLPAPT
jgi:hypothetical protein